MAADAAAQIRTLAWTDPAAAADAAWATSDTLHVTAATLGSRILRQAADAYDRAARSPYGRIPPPTPAGNGLRQAARIISAFAYLAGDRSMVSIVLITRLAALAEAVAELHDAQRHAVQAAAALRAAQHLRTATRLVSPASRPPGRPATATTPSPPKSARPRPATAAGLAPAQLPSPAPASPARAQPSPPRAVHATAATTTPTTRPLTRATLVADSDYGRLTC